MKVVLTVGQCSSEIDVRDDLLCGANRDIAQDRVLHQVGAEFTRLYRAEIERVAQAATTGASVDD